MRGYFAEVHRAGFGIGLSAGRLTKAMVEVLSQLPPEASPSKEVVVPRLRWALAMEDRPREKLSTAGQRKLGALAAKEVMTSDELLGRLIVSWRRAKQ